MRAALALGAPSPSLRRLSRVASNTEKRADDAVIASKPFASRPNAYDNASKALLNEVRRALIPIGADAASVLRATQRFQDAFESGEDMETVVARSLGYERAEDVPEAQKFYAEKIAQKLESNARTLAGEIERAREMYDAGVKAYGRGMYDDAVKWFEAAERETSETSTLGGKIGIYKALALDAYGQRDKALAVYEWLESVHPVKSIRKQAEELRYILEAPRLEIGENERVEVKLMPKDGFEPYNDKWATGRRSTGSTSSRREKTLEEEYGGEVNEPFDYEKLRLGLQIVGLTCVAVGVAWYSTRLR